MIKIGSPVLEEMMRGNFVSITHNNYKEIIGIINVKQFISELMLGKDNSFIEVLDEADDNITFPYIKKYGDTFVYSKVNVEKRIEEVIMYDYATKVTKIRLNNNIKRISDLNRVYLINGIPYIVKNTDKTSRLINLNTQKCDIKMGTKGYVRFIKDDLIVLQRTTKKAFFSKKMSSSIEVFRYPDMHHPVFVTRGVAKKCISFNDDILIFTE